MKFIAGDPAYWNFLAAATVPPTGTDEDPLFPWTNVKDGVPATIGRFNSLGVSFQAIADLNLLPNGNWETWSGGNAPGSWTVSGVVTQTGTSHGGSFGVSVGDGYVYRDVTVRSGVKLKFDGWARSQETGGTDAAILQIQNRRTGKWLANNGTWSSTPVWAANSAANNLTYQNIITTFQVESYETTRSDTCQLRVTLTFDDGFAFWDDTYLYPAVDFFSLHGHNLAPFLTIRLRHSDDNVGFTDLSDMTVADPSFYSMVSEVYKRHWRLQYVGTPLARVYYGEVVLSQISSLTQPQNWGFDWEEDPQQIVHETPSGVRTVYNQMETVPRRLRMSFWEGTEANFDELYKRIYLRSKSGAHPSIIIPMDDEPTVLHCRVGAKFGHRRSFETVREVGSMTFMESGFPINTP